MAMHQKLPGIKQFILKGFVRYMKSKCSFLYTVKKNPEIASCLTEAQCRNVTHTLSFAVSVF